jgi:hypothetical protein
LFLRPERRCAQRTAAQARPKAISYPDNCYVTQVGYVFQLKQL